MRRSAGFTLIELMIVVAIIGILAAIAIPAYGDYVRRGKITEATSLLADSRIKMEQFYMDNRVYTGGCNPLIASLGGSKYFQWSCTSDATTYLVTATGTSAAGTDGMTYTINQANVRASTFTTDGYTTCATRWIIKKGEAC